MNKDNKNQDVKSGQENVNTSEKDKLPFYKNDNFVIIAEIDKEYDTFNVFLDGFDAGDYELSFVMCAYVTDGEKVDYLCFDELNVITQIEYAKTLTYKFISETFASEETE